MKRVVVGLGLLVVIGSSLVMANSTSAHVSIKSQNSESAAILHIMPDDDPIAGEKASLMLDTQGKVVNDASILKLTVLNRATGSEKAVQLKQTDSLLSADYTFPSQGVYALRYDIVTDGTAHIFEYDMRVSRGVQGAQSTDRSFAWAEALLIGVIITLLVLAIVAWNRRKAIFSFSKL